MTGGEIDGFAPWTPPPRDPERRVGVELEFLGPSALEAARIVAGLFEGEAREDGKHRARIATPEFGDFVAELDVGAAHRDPAAAPIFSEAFDLWVREIVGDIGAVLAPMEIVCPPIPLPRAHALDALTDRLRRSGASGAGASPFYAFGAQLNIELLDRSAESILAYLRAFLLLRDWLRDEIVVEPSRRIAPFAAPLPMDYARLLLSATYAPDLPALIDDYLEFNPTRNRELDLLPLLRFLDEPRVVSALPDEKINARPAFHYRLPNMALEKPGWRIGLEWERWRRIEALAADPGLIAALSAEWRRADAQLMSDWRTASRCVAAMLARRA